MKGGKESLDEKTGSAEYKAEGGCQARWRASTGLDRPAVVMTCRCPDLKLIPSWTISSEFFRSVLQARLFVCENCRISELFWAFQYFESERCTTRILVGYPGRNRHSVKTLISP